MTNKTKWLLITIAIQFLLIAGIFRSVLFHPNKYFFEAGEDAIKSLMCMAYYIKYDHGLHFTGEIYPYGDHVIYADSQFPVSYLLQLVKDLGYDLSGYVPGIVNSAMMWSFIPCAIFTFLILSSFNTKHWFNCLAAIGITMLSPQVPRFAYHFSLSYLFLIPMEWYFMMKLMQARKKIVWMMLMTITLWFFGSIHLYYMAFIMMFAFSFFLVYIIRNRNQLRSALVNSIPLLVAVTIPYLVTMLLLKFTDPITDRVKTPWGFFFNYASFNSVFIPPVNNPINFLHLKNGFSEGYAYVGLVGWIGLLLLFFRLVTRLKKWKYHVLLAPEFLKCSLYASLIVLLFSFAFPFHFGLPSLLNYLGLIKQFRSEGRFAWIFYYVFSTFSVYYIFLHLRTWALKKKILLSGFMIILMVAAWVNDSYWNFSSVINQYKPYHHLRQLYFDGHEISKRLKIAGRSANEFQAVLALPLYHNGSEKFWFVSSAGALFIGLEAAYDTGLPLIDSHCGRTSLSQTMKALQLVSDSLIERNIVHDLPSLKPILIITIADPLSIYEQELLGRSKLIFTDSVVHLFELPVSSLAPKFETVRRNFFDSRESLHYEDNLFYKANSHEPVLEKKLLEGTPFQHGLQKNSGEIELFNGIIAGADTSKVMEASVWNKVSNESYETPELFVRQFDGSNNLAEESNSIAKIDPNNAFGWLRQSQIFKLHAEGNRIQIFLRGGKNIEANYFLLRPQNLNVYYDVRSDSSFWLNNFFIPASSPESK